MFLKSITFSLFVFVYPVYSLALSEVVNLAEVCTKDMKSFKSFEKNEFIYEVCAKVTQLEKCKSAEGHPIYHYDKIVESDKSKRVLVFSLIHGDEADAGVVGRYWMERLHSLPKSRNSWRVVPMLNPDGYKYKTRTNANKIDLNRNFPTKDWNELAGEYWKKMTSSNPRRFPGDEAGSEPEVKCALAEIEDFKPDFIISVHTPLHVLDFDGPKVSPPKYSYLPWKSLGHFPGSLGRYMWFEREVPVLTLELKDNLPQSNEPFEKLQDVIGQLVKIEIGEISKKKVAQKILQ